MNLFVLGDGCTTTIDVPIEYFIPSKLPACKSSSLTNKNTTDIIDDRKAKKYFESPSVPDEKTTKRSVTTENLLCSIPSQNESDFLSSMQQPILKISQANISPPIFLQRTPTSSFSVIYAYRRSSSTIEVVLKYIDSPSKIHLNTNNITLQELIESLSEILDEDQKNTIAKSTRTDVDGLRGSLPLPSEVTITWYHWLGSITEVVVDPIGFPISFIIT